MLQACIICSVFLLLKKGLACLCLYGVVHQQALTRVAVQIVYYDGQFDDSRLCIALACTAALAGAAVTNHTEATRLLKVRCS